MKKTAVSDKKRNKPLLISILVLLLIVILSIVVIFYERSKNSSGCIAYVYQAGELIDTIDLEEVTETYTFEVSNDNGASNTIEVRPGEIGIIDASCPDHLCMKTGFIHNSTMPIVCLPNQLVIEVKNNNATQDQLDGYSY